MRSVCNRKSAINRKFFRQNRRRDLVEPRPAVLFRNSSAQQSKLPGLFHKLRHQPGLLVLQFLYQRKDFLDDKFLRGLADQLLVVGEVGRCEYFLGKGSLEEKTAALGGCFANRCGGHRGLLVALLGGTDFSLSPLQPEQNCTCPRVYPEPKSHALLQAPRMPVDDVRKRVGRPILLLLRGAGKQR